MISSARANIKEGTMANCFCKASFVIITEEVFAEVQDDDGCEPLNNALCQLSSCLGAMPVELIAQDFISVDAEVHAVMELSELDIGADVAGVEKAKSSGSANLSEQEVLPSCTAAELASAFVFIRHCCAAVEGMWAASTG